MGIWDKLKGELIDIIEWLDESTDTMVYRFERYNNEIKNGAQLIVRESQTAVFVNEGQIADVFGPGRYELTTANLPILATLQGWKYGFNSPFKCEVYFVNTKRFTDLKWGTMNPIPLRDNDFGIVRVRAFGTYGMRIADPGTFLKEVSGTNWEFTTDQITNQLRNFIVSAFTETVAEQKIPVLDLAAQYSEMGGFLTTHIQPKFAEHGLELLNLLIENVSVPPEVEAAIDKRSSMGALGNLDNYMKYQAAEAMTKGAENPGGVGGLGAQMAAGMAMADMMKNSMQPPQAATPTAPPTAPGLTPPPVPALAFYIAPNNAQQGPFTLDALRQRVASGELTPDTLAWREGLAAWAPASQVPELSGLFAAVPPPLPPQQ